MAAAILTRQSFMLRELPTPGTASADEATSFIGYYRFEAFYIPVTVLCLLSSAYMASITEHELIKVKIASNFLRLLCLIYPLTTRSQFLRAFLKSPFIMLTSIAFRHLLHL